jgi:hypothetical protein
MIHIVQANPSNSFFVGAISRPKNLTYAAFRSLDFVSTDCVKEQDWQDGAQQESQLFLHPASPPQLFLAPRGHSLFTYSPVKYT